MNNNQLKSKVALLESRLDHLETELSYLDRLLVEFGFEEGIFNLKQTLEELVIAS